ncbi:energy-coupling factor ABC transporter permease [uncultured Aquincola sp.]|uniref:energy-coupling factor ABC transporter permease n=1 Tax=uncultured Aquincola sp. TaxID=886556 RepID=UPI0032B30770
MHIEPGLLAAPKLMAANVAAVALLAVHAPAWLKQPKLWLRTVLAALFFTLFMQSFHRPVGPSELHFVGAMPIYLLLGCLPTLFGFGLGLLLQGLWFEPQDLVHLSVNFLSLAVPLLALHHTLGRRLAQGALSVRDVLKLDAAYYAGVTAMVGFWLSIANDATPLADWAMFAASYLSLVVLEPVFTVLVVKGVQAVRMQRWARACFDERLTAA